MSVPGALCLQLIVLGQIPEIVRGAVFNLSMINLIIIGLSFA